MSSKSALELAFQPEAKPEDPGAMWDAYNKSWEDQVVGKGIKVYEQHCSAKLRTCMVADPFAMYVPNPNDAEIKQMIEDNANDELKIFWRKTVG